VWLVVELPCSLLFGFLLLERVLSLGLLDMITDVKEEEGKGAFLTGP
jgi:hypothetical protein